MWIKWISTMQRKQSLTQGATPASGEVNGLACTLIPHPQQSEGCGSVTFTSSTIRQAAEVCTMKRELQ
jgi:hypothetical protein